MNLKLIFNHPWLLLLIIPALVLVFLPYFRLSRKYRRTRNRVISLVLMSFVMILSVSVLAGATFTYTEKNFENELIILVDVSDSNNNATQEQEKKLFVQNVVNASGGDYKIGIITYAKDYAYVSEMDFDTKKIISDHEKSYLVGGKTYELDKTGTNLAQAVYFVKSLITNPAASKVLILSDGMETDGEGLSAVMSLVLDGTKVDTAYFPSDKIEREFQINFVQEPSYNLFKDEEFTLTIQTQSTHMTEVKIYIEDNGQYVGKDSEGKYVYYNKEDSPDEASYKITQTLQKGEGTVSFKHKFNTNGVHELRFHIEGVSDAVSQNNTYVSYFYLEVVNRILVIQNTDEGATLENMIQSEYKFGEEGSELAEGGKLTVTNFGEADCPTNIVELTQYDQVILVNISNNDMPEGFVSILNTYVHDFGGGLFTVGGNTYDEEDKLIANAYNYGFNKGSDFEKILPIETVDKYIPPKAVLFVVDTSGSMVTKVDPTRTRMDVAKSGLMTALNYLTPRDYVGLVQFDSTASTLCEMVSYSERYKAEEAIQALSPAGGTQYYLGLKEAYNTIGAFSRAKKKHIIFISDGEPTDYSSRIDGYLKQMDINYRAGITMSFLYIGSDRPTQLTEVEERILNPKKLDNPEPKDAQGAYRQIPVGSLYEEIRNVLHTPAVTDFVEEPFFPTIEQHTKVVEGITSLPQLDGFYGVLAKSSAVVPITGDYAPLYAQWTYGKGKVGSFMSDLNGVWSQSFLTQADENEVRQGVRLILNIIRELFPSKRLQYTEIKAKVEVKNFSPMIEVQQLDGLKDGDYYEAVITHTNRDGMLETQTKKLFEAGQLYKTDFTVGETYLAKNEDGLSVDANEIGVYFVTISKKDKSGKVLDSYSTVTTFSYSKEYDAFEYAANGENFMTKIARDGSGAVIDTSDPGSVLTAVTDIPMEYDPRVPIVIAIILLFLLDVAVRKFKFKWPWEIIRDRREKKRVAEIKARRANAAK